MKICLDAGHSLVTPGKRIPDDIAKIVGNMHEWEFNSAVATKVANLLLSYVGVTTYRSDDITGKTDIDVNSRVRNINKQGADLVISIHANAGRGTGCETFVYSSNCKGSINVANIVQKNMVKYTGMKNRGIKYGDFALVRDTKMNAILIECGFMDTVSDAKLLLSDAFRNTVATSIVASLVELYGIKQKPVIIPVKPKPSGYTGSSLVDYLKFNKIDSSFKNRRKLAVKYGVVKYATTYVGTSNQNSQLLSKMRDNH